jgi:hypothetical protein
MYKIVESTPTRLVLKLGDIFFSESKHFSTLGVHP